MVMEGLEVVIPGRSEQAGANEGAVCTPLTALAMGHLWGWAAPGTEQWGCWRGSLCTGGRRNEVTSEMGR